MQVHASPIPPVLPQIPVSPVANRGASEENNASEETSQQTVTEAISQKANENSKISISEEERAVIAELAKRDREVRAHEQAHAAVGGQYTGSPTYDYQRGPNGQLYAVSGEVSIDTSPIPGDPQATLEKAVTVQRAALAPAEPSAADRSVAAAAAAMASQARAELAQQNASTGAQSIAEQQQPGQFIDFHT